MKEGKKGIFATILVVLAIIALAGLIYIQRTVGFGKQETAVTETRPAVVQSAINVEVKEITKEAFVKTTSISGELEMSSDNVSVTSDVSGKVVKILVEKGQTVAKGDAVAIVDPSVPGSAYKQRTIYSSFEGTVLSLDVYEGQTVGVNSSILKIGNPSKIQLVLNIPEKYLNMVQVGTVAEFSTAAYPDDLYEARVSYVGKTVDKNTRTVETELEIINADSKLLEGMFVKAKLITVSLNDVFKVPSKCMSSYLGNSTVYLVKDSHAVRTVVETGISSDTETVITGGLSEGDLVVVAGNVTDSALVNVINK